MEDDIVHKLEKEKSTVPNPQKLGNNAVLAFSAFAGV